jgi:hypothetical protein
MVMAVKRSPGRQVEVVALVVKETDAAVCLVHGDVKAWVRKSVVRQTAQGNWTMPEEVAKAKRFTWL